MLEANLDLIVTCARHFEDETKEEIASILEEIGDAEPQIVITSFSGILTVKTTLSHTDVIKKIREKLEDEPWTIRYTMRVIPMFDVVECNLDSIADAAAAQSQKIKQDETYRITIEKRDSDISSAEIITRVADRIKNKVSLQKYDWVVLVETIGTICGVSILKDDEVLSVERTKRGSME